MKMVPIVQKQKPLTFEIMYNSDTKATSLAFDIPFICSKPEKKMQTCYCAQDIFENTSVE